MNHSTVDQELLEQKEDFSSNPSNNPTFRDIASTHISRRKMVAGSIAGAAAGFLAPAANAAQIGGFSTPSATSRRRSNVNFTPVSIEDAAVDQTMPTISPQYRYRPFAPWGTPIEPGATEAYEGDPLTRPTSKQAEKQVGIGHDGIAFFPWDLQKAIELRAQGYQPRSDLGMLCINDEFGINTHVLGKPSPESLEDVRLAQNVMGVSVLTILARKRDWRIVSSANTRRITVNTPVCFSGPAANSPLLQNPDGNIPLGTINNCGSGVTPWGTYITCEENFNGYFGATEGETFNDRRTEEQLRYGIDYEGFGYGWEFYDRRFDLSDDAYVNEANRFGWCVEIDPFDASQKPVKRTALGRFKHEAISFREARNGRFAAYMGDDQRGDYCYKFVSDDSWSTAIEKGDSPLDKGTLYVARFNEDGTGDWLPLDIERDGRLSARFTDQAELLVFTRIAADIVGATKMDRPEWTAVGNQGEVYWTLTNNDRKDDGQGEQNAANPEFENTDGHIIRMYEGDEGLGETFDWSIYLLASSTRGTPQVFTDPDAAYADNQGRLFIGTDGGQPDGLQDQLVVIDTNQSEIEPKRLLVGVVSDEITGFAYTPDRATAFVNVQHPGNGDPTQTNFPLPADGRTIPRDATLVITRKNRGVIGS